MDANGSFLKSIYLTACRQGECFEQQLESLLKTGCERFGMDLGVITRYDRNICSVMESYGRHDGSMSRGNTLTLNNTPCTVTLTEEGAVRMFDADPSTFRGTVKPIDFNSYLGIALRLNGQVFGVLYFLRYDPGEVPISQIEDDELSILMLITAAVIERKLHLESEQHIREIVSIVENSDDAMFTETLDRKITSWNRSAQELYGYTPDEIIGQSASILYPEGSDQCIAPMIEQIKQDIRTSPVEVVNRRKDGTLVNVSGNLSPIRDAEGRVIALSVVARNIDTRKQVERALAQSEQRYALASRGSNDGLWDWDLKTDEVYYSPRWKTILGYDEYEVLDSPEAWTDVIHASDIAQFRADLALHLAGKNDNLHKEYRVTTRRGETRWVLCRGVAVYDEKGVAIRIAGSLTDITRQKDFEAALRRQSQQDKLTGLPNRTLFTEILRSTLARAKRNPDYEFAVLFLDFDRFKNVNDSLGHEFGDMLLVNIAQQLRVQLRTVDTAARLGGDEFVILLDGIDGVKGAIATAERLLDKFTQPHNLKGHEVTSTASIGIVSSSDKFSRPEEMIRDADTAMYQAKASGKACYVLFDEQMHAKVLERLNLEKDLRRAIALGQMWVAYQPIVALENGQLLGFEALLRWDHPELGPIDPEYFISIAEETGTIVQIGHWVLTQACQQIVQWKQRYVHADDLFMNINISKRQLAQPDIVKHLSEVFAETGADPTHIKLEITESVIMDDRQGITPVLSEIRELGVQLAMDDFGTGHSSLSCLHRFPIDVLKIDREFIKNMEQRFEYTAVIQAIITLAHTLNISVVAEGLETADQVAQLQTLECNHAQGYYFSKPLNAIDADKYLRDLSPQRMSA